MHNRLEYSTPYVVISFYTNVEQRTSIGRYRQPIAEQSFKGRIKVAVERNERSTVSLSRIVVPPVFSLNQTLQFVSGVGVDAIHVYNGGKHARPHAGAIFHAHVKRTSAEVGRSKSVL